MALTGYETVTTFESDFNITQSFWYDRFLPGGGSRAGTLCDPHGFNIGDSLTTNYSIFQWDLVSVLKSNYSRGSLIYSGSTLESCDLSALYMNGEFRTQSADVVAIVACQDVGGFNLLIKTSFTTTTNLTEKPSSSLMGVTPEKFGLPDVRLKAKPRSLVVGRM